MRRRWSRAVTFLFALAAGGPVAARDSAATPDEGQPMHDRLAVTVDAFPDYLIGLPALIGIEVRNVSPRSTFYGFQPFGLFIGPGSVQLVLTDARGERLELANQSPRDTGEGGLRGRALEPGDAYWALVDVEDAVRELTPGRCRIEAILHIGPVRVPSAPIDVVLHALDREKEEDAHVAVLRRVTQATTWLDMVRYTTEPPDVSRLSKRARDRLALYLFLRQAVHGDAPIAALDPDATAAFADGPLAPEAGALRLEILQAASRGDARALEESLRARWPGLAWRLDDIAAGSGTLQRLRDEYRRPVPTPDD